MKNFLQRLLDIFLCLLFFNSIGIAQEIPNPKNPKEQPLDKPTEVKEAPQKQEPQNPKTQPTLNAVAGGTPAGQTPTSTQDGTFVNRFQDIPVNLFTGTPIIGFPIYTLTEPGGASVPLGLSYNASGMKGHDVSGWVGMNWTSLFQIQISRIVRGIPDEGKYTLDNNFNKTARNGSFQYSLKANGNEENDSQPDLFFLNINGQSYKFSFDNFKKAHFFPEADIDVQVNWVSDNPTNNVVVGRFVNWIVTMPDGTKYTFSGDNTESSFEMEAKEATDNSNHYGTSKFYTYAEAETVTSAWYCDKITTAFGHETTFDYRGTIYSFFRIADQSTTTNNCTFNGINKSINKVFVNSATLFKISNQTQVVEFNKGGWTQVTDGDSGESYWIINNTYPARQDIDTYSRYPTNSSNSRALHKITVYAKDDTTKVFEWKFKYDYNYGTDQFNIPPFSYNYSTVGYTHQRRFKLRSIEEPNGNKYTFKYYDDGFGLPSRFTQGIDHWGYLNGALGSNNMIGEDAFRVCASNQFGNRTATEGWSQYGTLTAISHSTGGSTILEYENHIARNYTRILGGSRIKKIMFVDSISNLKTAKRYDYQQINGKSSGFLCLKPVYHFDDKTNFASAPNQYWHSGLYQQLLSESGRPAVGYSRVKESILSNDETDSLGYTVSEFLQPLEEINLVETVVDQSSCTTTPTFPPVTTCDTYYYLRPWKWFPYHENTVGVSSRVAVYGKANQLLSEKGSAYTEQQLQVSAPNNFQQNYRSFRYEGQNYSFERQYFQFFQTFRVTSDTTKTYNQNGTNPVVSISNYEYPLQAKHNQLIKTTTKDSYGSTLTNTMKYPLDFEFDMISPSNIEAQGIQALQQKGIKSAVIESISKTKQAILSNDEFITGANYQTFYQSDSVGVKAGMPKSSFSLENLPRLSMTEANYDGNTSVFTRSNDYDLKTTAVAYTPIGLPVQSSVRFGTTSKIIYDANYPTLPISQISNVGLATEQTTTTEYAKILYGVSKQTGVNGLSVNNEYYADGKLKQQTDKDGNVLKHIQYVYRGQADDDPLLTTNVGYNRIITRIPRIATTNPLTLTHTDCAISVVYMDGTGRVFENVGYRASPNEKDMVSGVVDYDKFNRPNRTWLSIESTQNTGALLDTATVKSIARSFYQDQKPYSEVLEYEDSPLSRVFKSYGVGKVWQDSSKYVQMEYQTATGIKRLFVNNDDDYMAIGTYAGYQLSKTISTDERGSQVIEYKDKSGNVVQRDVQVDATNYLTTLFAFDPAGRLRFIFPPKAVIALGTSTGLNVESWAEFNENVYAYHYDGRGRVFESHKPGIGYSRVVYNRMNQPVLSQDDDELAKNNTWNFAQMDSYGRTAKTGQMQLEAGYTREFLQQIFDNFTVSKQFEQRLPIGSSGEVLGYDNNSFPNILRGFVTEQSLKNVSYFDDYLWRTNNPYSGQITDYDFQPNPYNSTAYSTINAKGLMTGGLHKIDNFGDFWFPSIGYFDDKNRPIQSIGYQDLYARNQSDTKYNFVGESLINQSIYRKSGDLDRIITKENTLDHVGRTKDYYYTLREGTVDKVPRLKMFSLFYDNIVRLKTKIVEPKDNVVSSLISGDWTTASIWTNNTIPSITTPAVINQGHIITIPANTTVQAGTLYDAGTLKFLNNSKLQMGSLALVRGAGLQTIEYFYNVRSQMRGVNLDASGNSQVSQNKLFSYKIDYHEDGRYFNGSISKQTWKSQNSPQNRSYLYSYDLANRLKNAQFSGASGENYSLTNSYDANGNTTNLQRYGKTGTSSWGLIDNLVYNYLNTGNKLQKVDDSATIDGFKNGTNSGSDYDYYPDGKLKKDLNRDISLIDYNFLDLVSKVTRSNGDYVEYFYTATGEKRQSKRIIAGITSYTLYDSEIIYTFTGNATSLNDFKVSEIQNSEGRFVNNHLEYGYTDHLGNLRLSYKDSLGTAFVVQSNAYDAWGYEIKPLRYSLNGALPDRYTWQGKEDLSLDGLDNWSDFGWRIEDRALGRWFTPDPEDQFVSMSPFAVCGNNPVSNIDPDGREFFTALAIGALIGALTNTAGQVIQNKGFNNWSWGSFGVGVVTGAIGGGVADALPGLLGQSAATSLGGNIAQGALNGSIAGGITGGIGDALNGGSFFRGALSGAIGGAIGGGIGGLIDGNPLKNALKNGDRVAYSGPKPKMYKGGILLKGVTVKGAVETGYDFVSDGFRDTWADVVRVGSTLGSSLANNLTMAYREGVHDGAPYNQANSPYRPYYVKDNEWSLNRDSDYMGGISNARETAMYNSSKNLIVDKLIFRQIPVVKFIKGNSYIRRAGNWGLNFVKDEATKDVTKGVLKR